jgi:hypothetical protein
LMQTEITQATNKADPADEHMQKAYRAYLTADGILHQRIRSQPPTDASGNLIFSERAVPNCQNEGRSLAPKDWTAGSVELNIDCLSSFSSARLTAAYDQASQALAYRTLLLGALCVLFCLLLLGTTLRMVLVTHRILNLGLTLALVIGIVFCFNIVMLFGRLEGQQGAFTQMVRHDYAGVYTAALLKRYSIAAHADQARWLITRAYNDQSGSQRETNTFRKHTQQVQALLNQAKDKQLWPASDPQWQAVDSNWGSYQSLDARVRTTATNGQPGAIRAAETLRNGQAKSNFDAFIRSVDTLGTESAIRYNMTLEITQSALTRSILLSVILFPLIGLLAVVGIVSRYREF